MVTSKKCRTCEEVKPLDDFDKRKVRKEDSYYTLCKVCRNVKNLTHYRYVKSKNPFVSKCYALKDKSKRQNLPFDLTPEYLESIWTGFCDVSGHTLDLFSERGTAHTPELDRIIPEKGYTQGNVSWISHRFNRIKCDAGIEELELILKYIRKHVEDV